MPFENGNLRVLAVAPGGDHTIWGYDTTVDTVDQVAAANYFNAAAPKLRLQDRIAVRSVVSGTTAYGTFVVTAISGSTVTVGGWAAGAAQAAAPAGGTGATAGAYDTAGNRDAMINLVNEMRLRMIAHGLMKGAA